MRAFFIEKTGVFRRNGAAFIKARLDANGGAKRRVLILAASNLALQLLGFVYRMMLSRLAGSEALGLLCAAAAENGIDELYDDIAADNPAVGLFLKHGFSETGRTEDKIILKKVLAQRPGG